MKSRRLTHAVLLSVLATLLYAGPLLLPGFTLSTRNPGPELTRADECIMTGPDWNCVPRVGKIPGIDNGAVSWQEIPASEFFHRSGSVFTKWNPYIGAGYPIFLDGLHRPISPTRIYLRYFTSEKARDLLVFAKFWIWSLGCALVIFFFEANLWLVFFGCFFSLMLGSVVPYAGLVYSDADLLGPLVFALLLYSIRAKRISICFAWGLALGIWIGLQSFVQSQVICSVVIGLACLWGAFFYGRRFAAVLVGYSAGFLPLAAPYALYLLKNFEVLVSTRSHEPICYLNESFGARSVWTDSLSGFSGIPHHTIVMSAVGLALLILTFGNRQIRFLGSLYLTLLAWTAFGLPTQLCVLPGLNGIHATRHLLPHVQSLGFLLLVACFVVLIERAHRRSLRIGAYVLFLALGFYPYAHGEWIAVDQLSGKIASAKPIDYEHVPSNNIFYQLSQSSQTQDRRHFSPDGHLFPNYSAAIKVMDLRVVNPFYPRPFYELAAGLFHDWAESSTGSRPDRFVGPSAKSLPLSAELQRLLVVSRVSLFTLSNPDTALPSTGPFSPGECKRIQTFETIQLWSCERIGAVGFFPKKIVYSPSTEATIAEMSRAAPDDLVDALYLAEDAPRDAAARGVVTRVEREADRVRYELNVEAPGYFVLADTWFAGWTAKLDGRELPMYRANVAFKSVRLTEPGHHALTFEFRP